MLPLEECNSFHMPVIEFPAKSFDCTVIVVEVVVVAVFVGPLGSNKNLIDTPLIEVVMVPLPNA